jgi:large subunit ribosomal protein L17
MEHRKAMRRNLAQNLFEHGEIRTTLTKAKDLRPYVERIITLAVQARRAGAAGEKSASLSARRRIHRLLSDRAIIPEANRDDYNAMSDAHRAQALRMRSGRRYRTGEPKGRLAFTAESVTHRLIEKVAAKYMDRAGGYTRIVRLPDWRIGDASSLAILQLVGQEEEPGAITRPKKTSRKRKADARYALAVATSKKRGKKSEKSRPEATESSGGEGEEKAE